MEPKVSIITHIESLQAAIDVRLLDVYAKTDYFTLGHWGDFNDDQRNAILTVVRAAYGRGYIEALEEDKTGNRGALCRQFGYAHP